MPPVEMSTCTNPGDSTGTVAGVGIGLTEGLPLPPISIHTPSLLRIFKP